MSFMHRRRRHRRSGRLGSAAYRSGFTRFVFGPGGGIVTPAEATATVTKAKVKKAVSTGSDCCPIVRVKCHAKREPQFYKGSEDITGYKNVKYCTVKVGSQEFGPMHHSDAGFAVAAARGDLLDKGCKVRILGDKVTAAGRRTAAKKQKVAKVARKAKSSRKSKR